MCGCLDSVECGTVEWNSGTVEWWNSGMTTWAIDDPVPSRRIRHECMSIVLLVNELKATSVRNYFGKSHRIEDQWIYAQLVIPVVLSLCKRWAGLTLRTSATLCVDLPR